MSPALELVRRLRRLGAEISVEEGTLSVAAPPGALPEELKGQIAAQKAGILALFSDSLQLLNERAVRIIRRDGSDVFALWRDADGREVRDAMDALGHNDVPVLYIDDPEADIPYQYREFAPEYVKAKWQESGVTGTLAERLEAEASARWLNRFFDAYGTSPRRSRITAATMLHGMRSQKWRNQP